MIHPMARAVTGTSPNVPLYLESRRVWFRVEGRVARTRVARVPLLLHLVALLSETLLFARQLPRLVVGQEGLVCKRILQTNQSELKYTITAGCLTGETTDSVSPIRWPLCTQVCRSQLICPDIANARSQATRATHHFGELALGATTRLDAPTKHN